MTIKEFHQSLLAAALALTLVTGAFLGGALFVIKLERRHGAAPAAAAFPAAVALSPASLAAKAAIVYDPATKEVLFAKNPTSVLPLASLTKLMTMDAVLGLKPANTRVVITAQDLKPEGDWGFKPGDVVSLSDLVKMALVASSNDAAAAAASTLGEDGVGAINAAALELGLSHSYFHNPTGLDLSAQSAGAYGSAYDVARMASAFYRRYPQYFSLTTQPSITIKDGNRTLEAKATAAPLDGIPGLLAAKTGFTDLAQGNLVAIFDIEIGHPLVAAVLGSTEEGRYDDIQTLIAAARSSQTP